MTVARGVAEWRMALGLLLVVAAGMAGCASPGPPRAPSLRLPEPVSDLVARRVGDVVELRFTAPERSTDKLPLRAGTMNGVLCRALESGSCVAVAGFSGKTAVATAGPGGGRNVVTWRDVLPPDLASGQARLLSYRVEFFNRRGGSAGKSDAAYTAAGRPPLVVEGLRAEGSRLGVVLHWQPAAAAGQGAVLLEREDLGPKAASSGRAARTDATPNVVWLEANSEGSRGQAAVADGRGAQSGGETGGETLDTTAAPDVPYRYTGWRSVTVRLGGRSIEVRSAASTPVEYTLREIYPPPAPAGLSAAGFFAPSAGATSTGTAGASQPAAGAGFAVDLVWQPVDSAGLIAGFGGYNVYRAALGGGREGSASERIRLNTAPVALPGFRDSTANPAETYRYFVTAVDAKGNESAAATVVVQPSQPAGG